MKKLKIIVDCDETISQTAKAVHQIYQLETGDYSTDHRNLHEWHFDAITPKWDRQQQDDVFINPELFKILEPNENAVEVLKALQDEGHDITICTVHNPIGIPYKAEWIRKYLPFIKKVIYIDSNGVMDKSCIKGDILFDDNINNLESSGCIISCAYGSGDWNSSWQGNRCKDWLEFKNYVGKLSILYDEVCEICEKGDV